MQGNDEGCLQAQAGWHAGQSRDCLLCSCCQGQSFGGILPGTRMGCCLKLVLAQDKGLSCPLLALLLRQRPGFASADNATLLQRPSLHPDGPLKHCTCLPAGGRWPALGAAGPVGGPAPCRQPVQRHHLAERPRSPAQTPSQGLELDIPCSRIRQVCCVCWAAQAMTSDPGPTTHRTRRLCTSGRGTADAVAGVPCSTPNALMGLRRVHHARLCSACCHLSGRTVPACGTYIQVKAAVMPGVSSCAPGRQQKPRMPPALHCHSQSHHPQGSLPHTPAHPDHLDYPGHPAKILLKRMSSAGIKCPALLPNKPHQHLPPDGCWA